MQAATAHRDRVQKVLGPQSFCAKAADRHVDFLSNLNAIVSAGEGGGSVSTFQLLSALDSAQWFGNHRAACYQEVEALDTVAAK